MATVKSSPTVHERMDVAVLQQWDKIKPVHPFAEPEIQHGVLESVPWIRTLPAGFNMSFANVALSHAFSDLSIGSASDYAERGSGGGGDGSKNTSNILSSSAADGDDDGSCECRVVRRAESVMGGALAFVGERQVDTKARARAAANSFSASGGGSFSSSAATPNSSIRGSSKSIAAARTTGANSSNDATVGHWIPALDAVKQQSTSSSTSHHSKASNDDAEEEGGIIDLRRTFPFAALIAALAEEELSLSRDALAKTASAAGEAEEQTSSSQGVLVGILRSAVSQNKLRFQQDGFDLDLSYITPRIIAMGFPSSGAEAFYRNPMDQVEMFFKKRHTGHYRIYNLCSERQYDQKNLEGRWKRFPFDDHNAPCPIKLIPQFVADASEFLQQDPKNVVAIHCKAGKGRTGVMIACLLMKLVPSLRNPAAAIDYFATMRTDDGVGVTIASQIRYINYYGRMLSQYSGEEPAPMRTLTLQRIVIWSPIRVANAPSHPLDSIFLVVEENNEKKLDTLDTTAVVKPFRIDDGHGGGVHYVFERPGKVALLRAISGDIKVTVYVKTMLGKDELFHYWFNTTLCSPQYDVYTKFELDKACKDRKNNVYCEDLMAQTVFIDLAVKKPHVVAPPASSFACAFGNSGGGGGGTAAAAGGVGGASGAGGGKKDRSPPNAAHQQAPTPPASGGGDGVAPPTPRDPGQGGASTNDAAKKDEPKKGIFARFFG